MSNLILITGTERSGVSMVAPIVWLCGADVGAGFSPAVHFDGRGNFENPDVKRSLLDPVFRGMSCDRNGWDPLPSTQDCRALATIIGPTWRRRFEKIIGGGEGRTVMAVSTVNALLWPLWRATYPEAKWIIVRRKDEDVVRSCLHSKYMAAFSTAEDWGKWVIEYKTRFLEIASAGCPVWHIWPEWMARGDLTEIRRMIQWLGLEWDGEAVEDLIAPMLWKAGVFKITR